jgi:hypothetical protein
MENPRSLLPILGLTNLGRTLLGEKVTKRLAVNLSTVLNRQQLASPSIAKRPKGKLPRLLCLSGIHGAAPVSHGGRGSNKRRRLFCTVRVGGGVGGNRARGWTPIQQPPESSAPPPPKGMRPKAPLEDGRRTLWHLLPLLI